MDILIPREYKLPIIKTKFGQGIKISQFRLLHFRSNFQERS